MKAGLLFWSIARQNLGASIVFARLLDLADWHGNFNQWKLISGKGNISEQTVREIQQSMDIYQSEEQLAIFCNLDTKTVSKHIDFLVKEGYITKKLKGIPRRAYYGITDKVMTEEIARTSSVNFTELDNPKTPELATPITPELAGAKHPDYIDTTGIIKTNKSTTKDCSNEPTMSKTSMVVENPKPKLYLEELWKFWLLEGKATNDYTDIEVALHRGNFNRLMSKLVKAYGIATVEAMIKLWFSHADFKEERLRAKTSFMSWFDTASERLVARAQRGNVSLSRADRSLGDPRKMKFDKI